MECTRMPGVRWLHPQPSDENSDKLSWFNGYLVVSLESPRDVLLLLRALLPVFLGIIPSHRCGSKAIRIRITLSYVPS